MKSADVVLNSFALLDLGLYTSLFLETAFVTISKGRYKSLANKVRAEALCGHGIRTNTFYRLSLLLHSFFLLLSLFTSVWLQLENFSSVSFDRTLSPSSHTPGINLYRLLRGYVWLAADPGPAEYFGDLSRWDNIAHDAINAVVTWIGDSLMVCPSILDQYAYSFTFCRFTVVISYGTSGLS